MLYLSLISERTIDGCVYYLVVFMLFFTKEDSMTPNAENAEKSGNKTLSQDGQKASSGMISFGICILCLFYL